MILKNAVRHEKHTEDTDMKPYREAPAQHLARAEGGGVHPMVWSVFFRVFPWQLRLVG